MPCSCKCSDGEDPQNECGTFQEVVRKVLGMDTWVGYPFRKKTACSLMFITMMFPLGFVVLKIWIALAHGTMAYYLRLALSLAYFAYLSFMSLFIAFNLLPLIIDLEPKNKKSTSTAEVLGKREGNITHSRMDEFISFKSGRHLRLNRVKPSTSRVHSID
jgi:hypothetical protein